MKHILILLIPFTLSAQTGRYIKDNLHGCLIWSDPYAPTDSTTWTGACKETYADGQGTLTWYEGPIVTARYTGTLHRGIPNGKGRYTFTEGGSMEGSFNDGLLHGPGRMDMPGGGVLRGNFVRGNLLDLDPPYLAQLHRNKLALADTSGIYTGDSPADSLFYDVLLPKGTIKGMLVLFPSTGESVETVISCNKRLMQGAYDKGILSVVLSSNFNKSLESDPLALAFFDAVFAELVAKYHAPADRFILCGLSLGGNNALRYTELSRDPHYHTAIRPLAVIGVDPPVDAAELYTRAAEEIDMYTADSARLTPGRQAALAEDRFLMSYFHSLYGGPPEAFPARYIAGSGYSRGERDGGNAAYLTDVPLRIYTDPDILWNLEERSRDYYHMNAATLSAMINFLHLRGNSRAELIPALGKGYRLDGTRHPHSWSVVDAEGCLGWMVGLMR